MMFSKAKLFKDEKIAAKIMSMNGLQITKDFLEGKLTTEDLLSSKPAGDYLKDKLLTSMIYSKRLDKVKTMADLWSAVQGKVKSFGKDVCKNDGIPWNEELWNSKREVIIYSGSRLKYSQNENLKDKLLTTIGSIMVECSKFDKLSTKPLLIQNLIKLKKYFKNNEVLV